MIIKTTLHLTNEAKQRLSALEAKTGKKRNELIVILINIMMHRHREYFCSIGRVKYQGRMVKHEWRRVHISVLNRDYDYLLDLRRFCKKSASLIISIALSLYYNQIINDSAESENVQSDLYSHEFLNYVLINESDEDVVSWKIYWGLPENLVL